MRKEHGSRRILLIVLAIILFFAAVSRCDQRGTNDDDSVSSKNGVSSDEGKAVEATSNALDEAGSPSNARGESAASGLTSTSRAMSFDRCIDSIQGVATELGMAPTNIAETSTVRIVRFNTVDGSVLVTCSRPDRKMVITRSPHSGRGRAHGGSHPTALGGRCRRRLPSTTGT